MKMKASELESSGMMSCQRATARAGEVIALEGVIDHRAEKNGVPRGPTWKLAWKRNRYLYVYFSTRQQLLLALSLALYRSRGDGM